MTFLLLGGTGQLGIDLQKCLEKKGISFVAPGVSDLDISNEDEVRKVIYKVQPKTIINTAALTDVEKCEKEKIKAYEVNALGPKYLSKYAKDIEAIFVQISTDYVFSGINSVPWNENSNPNPSCFYGYTKSEGEKFSLAQYEKNTFIVRTAWLYSENRNNFVKTMIRKALLNSDKIEVVNDQTGQPTASTDLANQVIDLIESKAPPGVYHGTNSGETTWFKLAQKIFELTKSEINRVIPVSTNEHSSAVVRPTYSVLGHDGWKKCLVPAMRDWESALIAAMPKIIASTKEELK